MTQGLPNGGELLRHRVERLEAEVARQRERLHAAESEYHAARLILQRLNDQLEHIDDDIKDLKTTFGEDVKSMRRTFNTWTFSIVGSVIAFALTVFALFGPP